MVVVPIVFVRGRVVAECRGSMGFPWAVAVVLVLQVWRIWQEVILVERSGSVLVVVLWWLAGF